MSFSCSDKKKNRENGKMLGNLNSIFVSKVSLNQNPGSSNKLQNANGIHGNFQWLWVNGSIRMACGCLPAVAYCLQGNSTPGYILNQFQVSEGLGLW